MQKLHDELTLSKIAGKSRSEEERTLEVIASRDDSLKNQKLKDLTRQLKNLYVKYEREVSEYSKEYFE
jgi:hypothetical protein